MNKNFDSTGLLKPQIKHSEFLSRAAAEDGISFDATVMGGGKTYNASAIARFIQQVKLSEKVFVICPKRVTTKWKKCLESFGVKIAGIVNLELLVRGGTKWLKYRKPTKKERADGVEKMMLSVLKIPKDAFVILDEVHRCKGPTSLSAGVLMALKRQAYPFHMISATAALSPLDMRALGFVVDLHDGSMRDYKRFCIESGAQWKGHHGAMFFDDEDAEAKAKMQQVHNYLFNVRKIASRLERSDFKGIFPHNQIIAEAYDMSENGIKIQHAYDEMEAEIERLTERFENYSAHIFAVLIAARRKIEMLKVPTLTEMMIDSLEEGHSPIVFLNFTDSIEAIYGRLAKHFDPTKIARYYGQRTFKENELDLAHFQSHRKYPMPMVANLASGGECVDMHDLFGDNPRDQIVNPSWNAIKVIQAAGRGERAYAKSDVRTYFPFAAGTVEEGICRRFQGKKDNLDILNNGDLIPSDRIFQFGAGKDI